MATQTQDCCCICLAKIAPRGGGQFLVTPGCCGKWFHQTCMEDLIAAGKNECPACRTVFPSAAAPLPAPVPAPLPAPVVTPAPAPVPNTPPMLNSWNPIRWFQHSAATSNSSSAISNNPSIARQVRTPRFSGVFRSTSTDPAWTTEEPVVRANVAAVPVKPTGLPDSSRPSITITPEYAEASTEAVQQFYANIHTTFEQITTVAADKTSLDVICILDVSGSMDGSKIENLKSAMKFVTSVLSESDRLAIVSFNSNSTTLQGLKPMSVANKTRTQEVISGIYAGGGTDIYAGMTEGWNILGSRTTQNASSVVFLLTDGQDPSRLEEKKALANRMRAAGSALFLFGFGADHDSEHMNAIANAAEGSFVYIETDDTVIDAFGAAIGTQQGSVLRDVNVIINVTSAGVYINSIQSGKYSSTISSDRKSATVCYRDLFTGEQRDCLVNLTLPTVSERISEYPLLSGICRYVVSGQDGTHVTTPVECVIKRVSDSEIAAIASRERSEDVDIHIVRFKTTTALQSAIVEADHDNYARAKDILEQAQAVVTSSVAFRHNNEVAAQLVQEIEDAKRNLSSRESYRSLGGKAATEECTSAYTAQRMVYAKKKCSYQSPASMVMQSSAAASKK